MSVNLPCGSSSARLSFQRPDATAESDDNGRDFKIRKRERPHLRATGIFFPVTIAHGFPATSDCVF
jgi:hypothetical protein